MYYNQNREGDLESNSPKNRDTSRDSYHGLLDENDQYNKEDRLGLIRKVYGILATQLLITSLVTLVPFLNDGVRIAIVSSPGIVLIAAIFGLILSCGLACVQSLARTVPMNYVLMFAFTACEAYTVAYICAVVNDSLLVVQAAFMTASLVLGLTWYAWTTKTDFTVYGGFFSSIGAVFLIFALFSVFFGPTLRLIYCVIGLALFSVYLVYDTQLILGGEDKYAQIENDDYILAAMILYLDIINIFIYILQLLTSNKD